MSHTIFNKNTKNFHVLNSGGYHTPEKLTVAGKQGTCSALSAEKVHCAEGILFELLSL